MITGMIRTQMTLISLKFSLPSTRGVLSVTAISFQRPEWTQISLSHYADPYLVFLLKLPTSHLNITNRPRQARRESEGKMKLTRKPFSVDIFLALRRIKMLEHAKGTCTVTAVEKSTRIVMIIFIEVTFSYKYGFQRGSPTLPICKFTRHVLFFGLITFHI